MTIVSETRIIIDDLMSVIVDSGWTPQFRMSFTIIIFEHHILIVQAKGCLGSLLWRIVIQ